MREALRIKAIPTLYRGRQYRSQLEAKWAAFFDLLGWKHEYEPFNLPGWLPDFKLTGANGVVALVEVKPIEAFSDAPAEKMTAALCGEIEPYLLLVGTRPVSIHTGFGNATRLGWMSHDVDEVIQFNPVTLGWSPSPCNPTFHPDIWTFDNCCPENPYVNGTFTDFFAGSSLCSAHYYAAHNDALWAEACNRVQWRGVRSQT